MLDFILSGNMQRVAVLMAWASCLGFIVCEKYQLEFLSAMFNGALSVALVMLLLQTSFIMSKKIIRRTNK